MGEKGGAKMDKYLAVAIAEGFCEGEGATRDEQIEAWQYLIDTGVCWQLQSWFHQTAKALVEVGICKPAKTGGAKLPDVTS